MIERRGTFTVQDIKEKLGEEAPTDRTILNRLDAMESLGVLASEGGVGRAPRVFFLPAPATDGTDNADGSQPTAKHASTFPYPGGKGRRSEWIIDKMPPHDAYIEVFGGSGAILYNKPRSKNEVYNDADDDLTQFFRVLREREDDLVEWLQAVPYARSQYEEWAEDYFNGVRSDDPIERAGRFFTLRYMQYAGDTSGVTGFKTRARRSPAQTFASARDRLHELAKRFDEVVIENRDYRKIFSAYDDDEADVLFYCDPPYVGAEGYYGESFDHEIFVDALQQVENDWMVSYSELPPGLEEYTVLERERRHRMERDSEPATERLVCNFDPAERAQFVSSEYKQTKLGE